MKFLTLKNNVERKFKAAKLECIFTLMKNSILE